MVTIILPNCPSVNEIYAGNWKIRYKSKAYKAWVKKALKEAVWGEWELKEERELKVDIQMYSDWYYKNWNIRRKDLANFFKASVDFVADNIDWFEDKSIFDISGKKLHNNDIMNEVMVITIDYNN